MRQSPDRDAGDVMHRLRAANPVPECPAPPIEEVWRRIDLGYQDPYPHLPRPTRRRRWPFALPPFALAAALAVVAAIALGGGGRSDPSILAQAVAATNSPRSVVHYVAVNTVRPGSGSGGVLRSNDVVWVSGTSSHVITSAFVRSARGALRRLAACELAVGNGRLAIYNHLARAVYLTRVRAGKHVIVIARALALARARACNASGAYVWARLPVAPLAAVPGLYTAGRLRVAGHATVKGQRVVVITGSSARQRFKLLVDSRTYRPVQSTLKLYGANGKLALSAVTRYTVYQRLALSPRTVALLALAPHPGIPVRIGIPLPVTAPALHALHVLQVCTSRDHRGAVKLVTPGRVVVFRRCAAR